MYEFHPVFKAPSNIDTKIWRYMDLRDFLNILHKNSLFFNKANKLRDPYEGTSPDYNLMIKKLMNEKRKESLASINIDKKLIKKLTSDLDNTYEIFRDLVLINSWHMNEYESAAMWPLYSNEKSGIAIQSTYKKLCDSFSKNKKDPIWIGEIRYIDYSKDKIDEINVLETSVIKRKSFEHEKEIRAVRCMPWEYHFGGKKALSNSKNVDANEVTDEGKYVSVNLNTLIEKIYVAPNSPYWFKEVIESIISKYNVNSDVIQSDIYKKR